MIDFNMTMEAYRGHPGVSASDLKNLGRSAAYAKLRPSKPSDAKEWGTAVHTAILEPDLIAHRYGIDPQHPAKGGYPKGWRNSDDYKERRATMLSKGFDALLTPDEWKSLHDIAERVRSHDIGKQLHDLPGHREASVFVKDDVTGLMRKCRPDWLIPSARMIVDVKTAADHRPGPFSQACRRYGYHLSAAYYIDTVSEEIEVDHYVFLVVNSDPPHEIESYTLDSDSIEQGRFDYRKGLFEWAVCERTGAWPGGSGKIQEIRLPEHAITYHEERMR